MVFDEQIDGIVEFVHTILDNKLYLIITAFVILFVIAYIGLGVEKINITEWYKIHYLLIFEVTAGLAGILVIIGWIVYFYKKARGEVE